MSESILHVSLARKVFFSSAHRYFNKNLSESENKSIFGKCYSEHGHGHNYALVAYIRGPINNDTGMVMNLRDVDEILKSVTSKLDHKHLNYDVAEFKDIVPTTEVIAQFLYRQLAQKISSYQIHLEKVRLYETDNLWAEYFEA